LKQYERICFEKQHVRLHGKPMADLIHPGHPLMLAITDLILSAHRSKLKQGSILVDPNDDSTSPKVLFMIDHSVRENLVQGSTLAKVVSRRLQFVEIDQFGNTINAGWAPHLDLQPIDNGDLKLVGDVLAAPWISQNLEALALHHASEHLVPDHYQEVKVRLERQADKILSAVNERLVKEINYWSDRFIKLSGEVSTGKQPRMQPENARRRVDELTARLSQRKHELEGMKNVVSSTPVVLGGALVIPAGLLAQRKGDNTFCVDAEARSRIEWAAMHVVMDSERALGHEVFDVSAQKCGWDVTARPPVGPDNAIRDDRHIEIKGRAKGATTVTVTKNEIFSSFNQGEKFILAIVLVDGEQTDGPYYIKHPFKTEPEFGVASVNYDLQDLLARAIQPGESL
jgi:hypothetical protein